MSLFWTWLMTTLLVVLVALALKTGGSLRANPSADLIDCKYKNPELHMYKDQLEICSQ